MHDKTQITLDVVGNSGTRLALAPKSQACSCNITDFISVESLWCVGNPQYELPILRSSFSNQSYHFLKYIIFLPHIIFKNLYGKKTMKNHVGCHLKSVDHTWYCDVYQVERMGEFEENIVYILIIVNSIVDSSNNTSLRTVCDKWEISHSTLQLVMGNFTYYLYW